MTEEQIYNPFSAINRIITDIEEALNPIVFKMQYLLKFISYINIELVVCVFAALIFYMFFVRHHHVKRKLRKPKNYFIAVLLLVIYAVFTELPIKIGPEFSVNFGLVVMPIAAKLFGPILAGAFGIIQYATSFIMHTGEEFNLSAMLVAGISGMLYGWIIYAHRTTYTRCLWAKMLVNVVCNIVLVPLIITETVTTEMVDSITLTIVSNICLAPLQALLIYIALRITKKIKRELRHLSWEWFK